MTEALGVDMTDGSKCEMLKVAKPLQAIFDEAFPELPQAAPQMPVTKDDEIKAKNLKDEGSFTAFIIICILFQMQLTLCAMLIASFNFSRC